MAEIDLSLWRPRLEQAVALQTAQHRRWHESQRILMGDWAGQYAALTDPDYIPVNYAKAYVSAVVASIYARNPEFFCTSRHPRHQHFARSMQIVLNYYKQELNLKAQMKRAITDALITGIAWVEVGYTATFGQLQLQPQDDIGLFQKLLGQTKRPGTQGVLNEYVKEVAPYATRLSPWNVYLAPGYHSVQEMPFLAVSEDLAPEDLAAHPLYGPRFASANIYPSRKIETIASAVSSPGMARQFGWGGASNGKLTHMHRLWHIWDKRADQRFIWLDGSQETAGPFPWNLAIEGFPQTPLIFNDLPETNKSAQSYPIGDLSFLMPQLKEINRIRTQMSKHRKRSGGAILAQETAMTDEQALKLQQADDLTLVRIKGNPTTDIANFVPGALSPDVYRIGDRVLADLDLIGQLAFLLPTISPGKERTATEANYRAQGAGTTRSEKVDVVEETMQQVAKRLAAVLWEYAPRSLIQEILGEEQLPDDMWPTLPEDRVARREMIERELEFSIEAGSTQPLKDKTMKNEQKIRFLNIIGGIAPERIKITSEGLGELADDLEMPELRQWMVLDDAEEQQAAEQENQLLMKGMEQVVSPNENHQLHEQVHAKAMQQGSTPAMDQHLLQHRNYRMKKQPGKPAQAGDGGTRSPAAKPEAQRQGVTGAEDLLGALGRSQSERGEERGGLPNV